MIHPKIHLIDQVKISQQIYRHRKQQKGQERKQQEIVFISAHTKPREEIPYSRLASQGHAASVKFYVTL